MAREHAQIKLAMWSDDEFRAQSPQAQHLYFVLLTSPSLSYCGVADWRPKRIAALAGGWSAAAVEAAAAALASKRYLVVDSDTEEVLIRSFVRNDGLMSRERMATAMAKAHAAVASAALRGVVVHELKRLHDEEAELGGWKSDAARALLTMPSVDPSTMAPFMPSANPSDNPSVDRSVMPLPIDQAELSVDLPPTTAPAPAPYSSSITDSLRSSGAAAPRDINAGAVVGGWVDAYRESTGRQPSGSMRAQAGKEAKSLLAEAERPELVWEAAKAAGAKGFATIEREYGPLVARARIRPVADAAPDDEYEPPQAPREVVFDPDPTRLQRWHAEQRKLWEAGRS